ncbi:MAG: hypothetical protein ABFR47_02445 [Verrucomicrobiota bacterium]
MAFFRPQSPHQHFGPLPPIFADNFTRPHQDKEIGNNVLDVDFRPTDEGEIHRETKLGGIISHYYRAAA